MGKKFDVVIGNPPYQEAAAGEGTRETPVYHLFMDAAYEIGVKTVLITPARFLFNAGFTPKAWNVKMLADQHLSVAHYESDSKKLFPGLTDPIKGGIAVTYRDSENTIGPIGAFAKHPELSTILSKVDGDGRPSIDKQVSSGRAYAYTAAMHSAHPAASKKMSSDAQFRVSTNSFEQLSFFVPRGEARGRSGLRTAPRGHKEPPALSLDPPRLPYGARQLRQVQGRRPCRERVRLDHRLLWGRPEQPHRARPRHRSHPDLPHHRLVRDRGRGRGLPEVRQHEVCSCHARRPQGHTAQPCIDLEAPPAPGLLTLLRHRLSKSIPEIDQQLYAKYGLDVEEIAFIEEKVKPMA